MRPPVAPSRRGFPGFSSPVVALFRLLLRRFGVTASSDFAASFCAPGCRFAVFCNRSVPGACARPRLLPLRSFLAPASSGVLRFRCFIVSRRLIFSLPFIIGPSLWPLRLSGFAPLVAASLFLFLRSVFPVLLPPCRRGLLQVFSSARCLFGCFLPSVLIRSFPRFVAPSRFPDCVTP